MRLSALVVFALTCAYLQVSFCLAALLPSQGVNKAQESLIRSRILQGVELQDLARIDTNRRRNDYLAVLLYLQYLESLKSQASTRDVSIQQSEASDPRKNAVEPATQNPIGKLGHARRSHATPTRSDKKGNHHERLINIATHPVHSSADRTRPSPRVSQPPAAAHLRNATLLTADIRSRNAPFHLRVVPPRFLLRQEIPGGKKDGGKKRHAEKTQIGKTRGEEEEIQAEGTRLGKTREEETQAERTHLERTTAGAERKHAAEKTQGEETRGGKRTRAAGIHAEETLKKENTHEAEKQVADLHQSRGVSSDPVSGRGTRAVATSRQFSGPPFDLLPRLLAALDNPAVVVLLLILNVSGP